MQINILLTNGQVLKRNIFVMNLGFYAFLKEKNTGMLNFL